MTEAGCAGLVSGLRAMLATGFLPGARGVLPGLERLAHPLPEGTPVGWAVSGRLLDVRPDLASDAELVCALLAQIPDVRQAWLAIAAGRCLEAGKMVEPGVLVGLVSGLRGAAAWVEEALGRASLAASPFAGVERELLGMSLDQTAALPTLTRILAVTARLSGHGDALPALPWVDAGGVDGRTNWIRGRLLALPGSVPATSGGRSGINADVLLHGGFGDEPDRVDGNGLDWVLVTPWALLSAMLVFAQDVWNAEGRGGLLLELPGGGNPYAPGEISLVVVGPDGDEVACGTMADLLLHALDSLGMSCFPRRPSPAELNALLSPLIGRLLERRIWRFQDGSGGQAGQYQIHHEFADACYRLPGSKMFNRTGKHLWQSIRISAEGLYGQLKQTFHHGEVMNALGKIDGATR